ncbi:MAG: hypothetical protein KGI45_04005 [Patescibacteria group bacterium]|nr:hypothetical protein [Patescibacteria group bacterium]MDE1941336.1 hypothetical protein [Patescibacteria group bacterium]MDE1967198.1 hypothetical protein [Patescibacteria group bacterium]
MSTKSLIWIGATIGGGLGGYIPMLWGGNIFGVSSIILSTIGGLAGIWAGFKLGQMV